MPSLKPVSSLRAWLRRFPKPTTVKVELPDDEEKIVSIGMAKSWARDAELTIGPALKCEALDDEGRSLRVWECDSYETIIEDQKKPSHDPLSTSVERIAEIITTACDRAVQRHGEMVAKGFEHMAALVQVLGNRNAALEKAWQQLLFSQQQQQVEPDDPNNALMGTLVQLAMGAGVAPPKPPPVNGAAKE